MLYKANTKEDDGKKLTESYGAQGLPHFFLVDAQGGVLDRWVGYLLPGDWLAQFENAVSDPVPIALKASRFEQQPTEELAAALARIRASEGDLAEAARLYAEAQRLAPAPRPRYAFATFMIEAQGLATGQFSTADVRAAADAVMSMEPGDDLHRAYVGAMLADIGSEREEPELATAYLEPALQAAQRAEGERAQRLAKRLEVDRALLVEKDLAKAYTLKKESMPSGWEQDPDKLNEVAWWAFQHNTNLEDAAKLAQQGIDLAKEDSMRAAILDTAAEIANARGQRDEAIALITKAGELDPENAYYKEQLAKFQGASS